jgi:hypothetical protein
MSTNVTEIKKRIRILTDEYSSAYLSDSQFTTLWSKASYIYFGKLISKFQATRKVTEDLQPIMISTIANVTSYEIDLSSVSNYWKLINVKPTYTVSGKTYSKYARELKASERGAVFSQGSYMYPRYVFAADTLYLYPETGTCSAALVEYFRKPYDLDFAVGANDVPYDLDIVDGIVYEFANQLALLQREDLFFTQTNFEIEESPE